MLHEPTLHEPSLSEIFVQADKILRSTLPAYFHDQLQTPLKSLDWQSPVSYFSKGGSIESIRAIFNPLIEAEIKLREELPEKFHDQITKPQWPLGGSSPMQHVANGGCIQTIQHLFQPARGC